MTRKRLFLGFTLFLIGYLQLVVSAMFALMMYPEIFNMLFISSMLCYYIGFTVILGDLN